MGKKGRNLVAASLIVLLAGVVQFVPVASLASADPSVLGSWDPPFNLPLIVIHATVLPNDSEKVLLFSTRGSTAGSASWVLDTSTLALKDVSLNYSYDMMCGGNTLLSDGRVFVAGGRINANQTAIFSSDLGTWNPAPSMALARYYPTALALPNETVLIFYGRNSTVDSYDPKTNTITPLPASANQDAALYPRMHVMTDGRLFHAGPEEQTQMFDPATSTWTPFGQLLFGDRYAGTTVLLPGLQKVLAIGGNKGAGITNTTELIDFSQATPQWRYTQHMNLARQDLNAVLLPDGTVLVVGGRGPTVVPRQAELFVPLTETWTLMAAQVAERAYHSTAILLPDGRVLSAGDGDSYRYTGEIYSPPYLFKGARPVIDSVSQSSLGYGQAFTISTAAAGSISRVALIKPGPVSHGVNHDQRYVDLDFTVGTGQISATAPPGPNFAPPGWYMLFVVNSNGVPSVASWVRLANAGDVTCTPSAPSMTVTPAQGPAVQAGTTVPYTVSVKNRDSAACTASSFDLQATVPGGWQGAFTAASLTVAPGATSTTTLNVTSAANAAPNTYPIDVSATRTGTPGDTASASVSYTVAQAGSGGTFADDFNRDTGLGSNWQVIQGTLSIVSNELRNGATTGLHAAIVPSLVGANETVTAKFATTAQSSGSPTLGLILRYQDPKNYYMLYRQVGGSSLLRIAKIVNGVATVLGSTAITNPQVNIFFSMTAAVNGSTLTLTQGTVKVSVTDNTFASGNVGIVLGNTNATYSHKADDFSATVNP